MAPGPLSPLKSDLSSSSDLDRFGSIVCINVADDVRVLELVGGDEASVGGPVGPAGGVLHGLPGGVGGVVTDVGLAVDDNVGDVAVGVHTGSGGEGGEESLGSHCDGCWVICKCWWYIRGTAQQSNKERDMRRSEAKEGLCKLVIDHQKQNLEVE